TTNGGTGWTVNYVTGVLNGIDVTGSSTAVAVGSTSGGSQALIMKTTNGGSSWNTITNHFTDAVDVRIFGADTIELASATRLYRSVDGGNYWDEYITPASNRSFKKIDFLDSQHGFAVGNNGYCMYTTNGGTLKPFIAVNSSASSNACQGDTITFSNFSNPAYTFSWY